MLTCSNIGHIHAFYLEYVYYNRIDKAKQGITLPPAGGVYSQRIQAAGRPAEYGTVAPAP